MDADPGCYTSNKNNFRLTAFKKVTQAHIIPLRHARLLTNLILYPLCNGKKQYIYVCLLCYLFPFWTIFVTMRALRACQFVIPPPAGCSTTTYFKTLTCEIGINHLPELLVSRPIVAMWQCQAHCAKSSLNNENTYIQWILTIIPYSATFP